MDFSFLTQRLDCKGILYTFLYRDNDTWEIESVLCNRIIHNTGPNVVWGFKRLAKCPISIKGSTCVVAVEFDTYIYSPTNLLKDIGVVPDKRFVSIRLKTPYNIDTTVVSIYTVQIYLSTLFKGHRIIDYNDGRVGNVIYRHGQII